MHDVFKGIVVGFIGLIIWVLASIPIGVNRAIGVADDPIVSTFMLLGFLLMVGGPAVYIVIIPVVNWWRRRRAPEG